MSNIVAITYHSTRGTLHHPSRHWVTLQWETTAIRGASSTTQFSGFNTTQLKAMLIEEGIIPKDARFVESSSEPGGRGNRPKLKLPNPTQIWAWDGQTLSNLTEQEENQKRQAAENRKWCYRPQIGEKILFKLIDEPQERVGTLISRHHTTYVVIRDENGREIDRSLFSVAIAKLEQTQAISR